MTRIIVCGGRDFARIVFDNDLSDMKRAVKESSLLIRALNAARDRLYMDVLIHGGATGADTAAASWADSVEMEVIEYRANWTAFGLAAGPIRNQRMIDDGRPDYVLAFPGGSGTSDMVKRAEAASVVVHRIGWK